jgi:23S rRNA (cytidine2498-2'-O)-methyltransferase
MPSPASAPPASGSPAPARRGEFLLVTCQGGAEAALVARQEAVLPGLRKGVWRRGVVTYRLPSEFDPPDDFFPDLVFGRTCLRSLGQVTGADVAARVAAVVALAGTGPWDDVHVWPRAPSGEPAAAPPLDEVPRLLRAACGLAAEPVVAAPGSLVLDCLLDGEDRWWVGWHRTGSPASVWPGGIYPQPLPAGKASRAWLKLDEAIATFALEFGPGQRAVELGAAPGGASQRLLEAGLSVVGVDPAVVDAAVAAHPRFRQWRMRARDVKRQAFRPFDWIVCDMNIDPVSTMESLGRILTAPGVRPRGIVATLKLPDWSRAEGLAGWLAEFRSWGFQPAARQLSTGGREVCVVGLRSPAGRRATRPPAP